MPGGFRIFVKFALAPGLLAACDQAKLSSQRPTPVAPAAETAGIATSKADTADDPAIWAAEPGTKASLAGHQIDGFIAGTNKQAGLYIYRLDGVQLQFQPEGLLNNVALSQVSIDGRVQVVLGASDRRRRGVALYVFDPGSSETNNTVRPTGFIPSDVAEPYGFCMGHWTGKLHAILLGSSGDVRIYRLEQAARAIRGVEVARFSIGSKSEGCAVDEIGHALYIGEEDVGLWRYPINDLSARILVEPTGRGKLTADVEGVAIIRDGERRYLLVSSQGDSAFGIWRIDGPRAHYAGRFSVAAAGGIDAVTGTDGLDALGGRVGTYPEGLVVVQDDVNDDETQNYKLIDWRQIRSTLRL